MRCQTCGDKGLVKIQYQQDEGYDLAICACHAGQWYRMKGMVAAWMAEHQATPVHVGRIEDFTELQRKKA